MGMALESDARRHGLHSLRRDEYTSGPSSTHQPANTFPTIPVVFVVEPSSRESPKSISMIKEKTVKRSYPICNCALQRLHQFLLSFFGGPSFSFFESTPSSPAPTDCEKSIAPRHDTPSKDVFLRLQTTPFSCTESKLFHLIPSTSVFRIAVLRCGDDEAEEQLRVTALSQNQRVDVTMNSHANWRKRPTCLESSTLPSTTSCLGCSTNTIVTSATW